MVLYIPSKIGTLDIGDNEYFVLVTDNEDNVKLYTLQIRRRPIYTVTFNTNGGSNLESIEVEEDSLLPNDISTPIKQDYIFHKWDYNLESPITKNITLTAIYNLKKYNINYVLNGGVNNSLNPSQFTINDYPLTLHNPTQQDATFLGWYDNNEFTGNVITEINDIHNDITLYAKWKYVWMTLDISDENDGFIDRMFTETANYPYQFNELTNSYFVGATITFNPNNWTELIIVKEWDFDITVSFELNMTYYNNQDGYTYHNAWVETKSNVVGTISSSSNNLYEVNVSMEITQDELANMVGAVSNIQEITSTRFNINCSYSGTIVYKTSDQ